MKIPGQLPVHSKLPLNLLQANIFVDRVRSLPGALYTNLVNEVSWRKLEIKNKLAAPVGREQAFSFGRDLNSIKL